MAGTHARSASDNQIKETLHALDSIAVAGRRKGLAR